MLEKLKTKKKWIAFVILILLAGYGYHRHKVNSGIVQYDTAKVESGDLVQAVDATGQIRSANDLSLRFEIPGVLSAVNVKEGNSVKAGQVLATLRLSELNAAVAQAQANLNKQLAGATPEYLAQLQASLDKAKNDLNQAQGAGSGVENSKFVQNAYDDLLTNLLSNQISLTQALTAADNVLGVDNSLANNNFVNYLSTTDSSYLKNAKQKYLEAKAAKKEFDTVANFLSLSSDHASIDEAVKKGESALLAAKDCLFYVAGVLDNTFPNYSLPQSQLDGMRVSIQSARTDVTQKYSSLVNAVHAVDNGRNNYASLVALLNKAQAAYDDAKNPPREVDVAYYRAALSAALANRDKAIIVAPIDGVVTKISHKAGESVSSAEEAIRLLSPHYEIEVDVSETDITKLKVGNNVSVTLDAFGEEVKFSGKVFNIDPGATVVQDVVYYKVKISLDDTDKSIKPDMTANVSIETDRKENTLFIPSRSVITENGVKKVKILENNQPVDKEVTLGIKGNDGKIEILSGLTAGQDVILGVKK